MTTRSPYQFFVMNTGSRREWQTSEISFVFLRSVIGLICGISPPPFFAHNYSIIMCKIQQKDTPRNNFTIPSATCVFVLYHDNMGGRSQVRSFRSHSRNVPPVLWGGALALWMLVGFASSSVPADWK
jgi:hypothetical protein